MTKLLTTKCQRCGDAHVSFILPKIACYIFCYDTDFMADNAKTISQVINKLNAAIFTGDTAT